MKHLFSFFLFLASLGVQAQVPGTLSYQGLLVSASGEPVTDGFHFVKFRFHTDPSAGEVLHQTGTLQVTTFKGMFTIVIGSGELDNPALTLDISNAAYIANRSVYVEIIADGVPLAPRVPLTTVVNAQHAHNANVVPASGITGILSVPQGGTGVASISGVFIGNGTAATTGLAATGADQFLKSNADNTGYEFAVQPIAGSVQSGVLSTTDWNTFNNKAGSASNGLTMTGTDVALGGTLTANTNITTGGYNVTLDGIGNVGIGTTTPAAKLDVNGTTVLRGYTGINRTTPLTEYSGFDVEVSAEPGSFGGMYLSTPDATSRPFYAYSVNGSTKAYHYADGSTGSWRLNVANSDRISVSSTGNVGIGITTANAPLQFAPTTASRKVVLYETNNNDHEFYGFGVNGSTLRYQVSGTATNHVFYAGASSTTSNELMRITGTGNVGIGTNNPSSLLGLDKIGSGNHIRFTEGGTHRGSIGISSGSNNLLVGDADNDMIIGSQSNLLFGISSTERMRLSTSGNLGIGTTTPANKLDVEGGAVIGSTYSGTNTAPSNGLLVEGSVGIGTTSPSSVLHLDRNGYGNVISFSEAGSSRALVGVSGGADDLIIGALNNYFVISSVSAVLFASGGSERMRLTAAGNIGIGTNTPVNKLDVEGGTVIGATYSGTNTAPANGLLVEGNVGIGATSPASLLHLDKNGVGNSLRFTEGGTLRGLVGIAGGANDLVTNDTDNDMSIRSESNLLFATGSTEKMRLTAPGNLGIGISAPVSRLHLDKSGSGNSVRFSEGGTLRGSIGIAGSVNDLITGDADNDLIVRSESNVLIGAGGTERMRLTSTGNLGVGISSPLYPLSVYTSTNTRGLNIEQDYAGASEQYGLAVDMSSGTGTAAKYGIYTAITGTTSNASDNAGLYNDITPNGSGTVYGVKNILADAGTGARYGFYNEVYGNSASAYSMYGGYNEVSHAGNGIVYGQHVIANKTGAGAGTVYGFRAETTNDGTGDTYLLRGNAGGSTTGTKYGAYISGEEVNYFSGNVGLGTTIPQNILDIEGGAVIGATYSGTNTAPANGLLVQGSLGLGTTAPQSKLDVEGGAVIGTSYSGLNAAPTNGLLVQGNVGFGTTTPANKLDVEGGAVIGANYSGTITAPVNSLLVEGYLGLGTDDPADKLHVYGNIRVGFGTTGCVKDADGTVISGTCASDERFKTSITEFPKLLDKFVQLQPVHFYWRKEQFPDKRFGDSQSYGLIAQNVEKIFPELVLEDEEGYKAVNYSKLPLLSIQAIKEQQTQIEQLQAEVANLKQQLSAYESLSAQVEELKKLMTNSQSANASSTAGGNKK